MIALVVALALTISGPAHVVDGDTVVVAGATIRLKGIDAAERKTLMGEAATLKLRAIVGGSELSCRLTGEKTHKREVGFCFTADGTDIAQALITSGFALACPRYSDRYLPFEKSATLLLQGRARYCVRQ